MEEKKVTRSFFHFEITQTTKVLLYKMKQLSCKKWNIDGDETSGHFELVDLNHEENKTLVMTGDGYLKFITVGGYEYVVQDKTTDGAEVSFAGPVNALLTQSLMPRMTYVPNTLEGMSEDMEDFMPIAEYMAVRAERNARNPNPQDKNGWRVNMKFNNELTPFLPEFYGDGRENPKKRKRREKAGKFARR